MSVQGLKFRYHIVNLLVDWYYYSNCANFHTLLNLSIVAFWGVGRLTKIRVA